MRARSSASARSARDYLDLAAVGPAALQSLGQAACEMIVFVNGARRDNHRAALGRHSFGNGGAYPAACARDDYPAAAQSLL